MVRYRSVISAGLMACAMHGAWPLGFIGLVPMFVTNHTKKSFFIWGLTYMGILHAFLLQLADDTHIFLALMLWAVTSIYYGFFYGIGGWLLYQAHVKLSLNWIIGLPVIWPLIEWTKSIGPLGNTNGNLGFLLSPVVEYVPIYAVIGHLGVGILLVIINSLMGLLSIGFNQYSARLFSKISLKPSWLLVVIILIFLGMTTIRSPNQWSSTAISATVFQTGIEQKIKQNPQNWDDLETDYLVKLSKLSNTLVILPETILPTYIKHRPFFNALQSLSDQNQIAILFGSFITPHYNGSFFMQPNQPPIEYKKQQLMPFGEFMPFRKFLPTVFSSDAFPHDFKRGEKSVSVAYNHANIHPIICLEGIYGAFYSTTTPGIIAILANHAWFDHSSASKKLRQFAQIHAAEFQVPVFLATNYGGSAIISPKGRIIQSTVGHKTELIHNQVNPSKKPSFFQQYPWLGCLTIVLFWGVAWRRYLF